MNLRELQRVEKLYIYFASPTIILKTGCIGLFRGAFGSSHNEFYSDWFEYTPELKTEEFNREFDKVINDFRFDDEYGKLMGDLNSMKRYCVSRPESKMYWDNKTEYAFRADTDKYSFILQLKPDQCDFNFHCYCFEKEALDKKLESIGELPKKAKFLSDFFASQKIDIFVNVENCQLVAKDDEGNKWKDDEIYDFALNECLAFSKDGALPFGFGAAEKYVEQLKADAREFGVEITSFVNENKGSQLQQRITSAKKKAQQIPTKPSKIEEKEY